MNISQPTLIQFEAERKRLGYIPPVESDSFYSIGDGTIDIYCLRGNSSDYRFDLYIYENIVYTGIGEFKIVGDIVDIHNPYNNLYVLGNNTLGVNQLLTIDKGILNINGTVETLPLSRIHVKNNGSIMLTSGGILSLSETSEIVVENGSSIDLYGTVRIHISKVEDLITNPNVHVDTACILDIYGLEVEDRAYSLLDYTRDIRKEVINTNTQGEENYINGRIRYVWRWGSPTNNSYGVELNVLQGNAILGDFRLPVFGIPEIDNSNKIVTDIRIRKDCTLYISDTYEDYTYYAPELYIGHLISNVNRPAKCLIEGTVIVNGPASRILVDRKAQLIIEEGAELHLKNRAVISSSYNDEDPVFFINGTLIIDSIDQIATFHRNNIIFGEYGKVVILNPATDVPRILFTTPNGIKVTSLYRIFNGRINHLEYHINNNTGIAIDMNLQSYSNEMNDWFCGLRIEKAIKEGVIIWHNNGYIELNNSILPWATKEISLYEISRLFKTTYEYPEDILQDIVNRLQYTGSGNILFKIIENGVIDIILTLQGVSADNIIATSYDEYILFTSDDGILFLSDDNTEIVSSSSKRVMLSDTLRTEFKL